MIFWDILKTAMVLQLVMLYAGLIGKCCLLKIAIWSYEDSNDIVDSSVIIKIGKCCLLKIAIWSYGDSNDIADSNVILY